MNELDEATKNARAITKEADIRGYTRRALECIIDHLRTQPPPSPPVPPEQREEGVTDEATIACYMAAVSEFERGVGRGSTGDERMAAHIGITTGRSSLAADVEKMRAENAELRRVVDAVGGSAPTDVPAAVLDAMVALPASLRPEPGGGK